MHRSGICVLCCFYMIFFSLSHATKNVQSFVLFSSLPDTFFLSLLIRKKTILRCQFENCKENEFLSFGFYHFLPTSVRFCLLFLFQRQITVRLELTVNFITNRKKHTFILHYSRNQSNIRLVDHIKDIMQISLFSFSISIYIFININGTNTKEATTCLKSYEIDRVEKNRI